MEKNRSVQSENSSGGRILFLSLLALLCVSCASTVKVPHEMVPHLIALDGDGDSYEIEVSKPAASSTGTTDDQEEVLEPISFEDHLDKIKNGIKGSGKKNVLIYVHGGLKGMKGSVKNAVMIKKVMEAVNLESRKDDYYPVFVNWESGMLTSYGDHLWKIRQGRVARTLGPLSSPFYFLADMGRALTRAPATLGFQIYNGAKRVPVATNGAIHTASRQGFNEISLGENTWDASKYAQDSSSYLFPGVAKIVTTPLLDAIGKGGWDNMLRRTQTVFRTSGEFKKDIFEDDINENRFGRLPTGGLARLMAKLQELPDKDDYKVTLVGHSMGTIILNQLIRMYGGEKDLKYDRIVYMAAACTMKDFQASVIHYMEEHDKTKFYNLTLHPVAEERENVSYDILPRGSLLAWIDDFATNPASFEERTLGRWNNMFRILHTIQNDGVRERIHLKGFGLEDKKTNNRCEIIGKDNDLLVENITLPMDCEKMGLKTIIDKPQQHGDFNDPDQLFWLSDYWKAPSNNNAPQVSGD